jgi:glutamate-ammonia-ligase adenylyltransferase
VPILAARGFREPETSAKLLAEFVHGPGHRHRAPKTEEAGMKLVERIIELCPGGPTPKKGTTPHLSDPDRVIARVGSFVTAHGSRAALYELWSNRLPLFDLMLWLTDRSEYLAQLAVRTPDLLDELEEGGHLRRQKGTAVMLTELRRGQKSSRERGIRDNWLIHYVEAEKTRIGLRDILQLSDADEPEIELTALAEAVLQYTLETLMAKHRLKTAPFAVIGLGGLGSREVVYGSDLEIFLVVDKPAARLPKLKEMAEQWLELLQPQLSGFNIKLHRWTEGQEGNLISTAQDFDDYFRHRAGLKDLFSLTTARHVAGDLKAAEKLWGTVMNVTELGRARPDLAAWSEDWPERLHAMRLELQGTPSDGATDALAIETGTGGLVDVEFIVQSASLAGHWHEPNTARALIRAENDGSIPVELCSPLRTGYKKLRNVERILRRWSFQAETELPADLEAQTRVSRRCGMETAEAFLADLAETRKSIRAAYNQLMPFSRHRPK